MKEDDFGFSFITDNTVEIKNQLKELEDVSSSDKELIEDLTKRLSKMYSAILPLLDNLCQNPEKTTILWPDRVEKIKTFKAKLNDIKEGL